jgi:hypothetical protein
MIFPYFSVSFQLLSPVFPRFFPRFKISRNFTYLVSSIIIFKRHSLQPALHSGVSHGNLVEVSETGYMNSKLFIEWLHFINYVKSTAQNKVSLLLGRHTTHSNFQAIQLD